MNKENHDIRVRRAGTEDILPLVQFNHAMAFETENKSLDQSCLRKGVEAVLEDDSKGFYLIAETVGEVVGGLLITYEWSDWRNALFWWIQSVYILPRWRKKGVYKCLYKQVLIQAGEKQICGIRLYVASENHNAQKVYRRLGMTSSHYELYEVSLDTGTESRHSP